MLAKAGLDEAALECGAHWPGHEMAHRELARSTASPSAIHNNCSGKHAGFLCLGCLMARRAGADPRAYVRGYVQRDHPVMREISAALQASTGCDLDHAPVGTDGCSIPTYGIPLKSLAAGFARLGTELGLSAEHAAAARRLRAAVARAPFFVGGSGRFDTRVMERLGERVFCKVGAEGVYCASLPEQGLGVAIKIDDGNNARGAEVVMAAVIESLVRLERDEREFMHSLSDVTLKNWNGIEVGALKASAVLRDTLASC
jgi:L-asparaginase II